MFLWLTYRSASSSRRVLSLWSETDPSGLEDAAKKFGIGAAAAHAASRALEQSDRSIGLDARFRRRAARRGSRSARSGRSSCRTRSRWRLEPPRIRRPLRSIAVFNGLFLLGIASYFGVAWLHEQLGASEVFGIAASLVLVTLVALLAMWLLPHRATRARELLPGAFAVALGHQLVQIVVLLYFAPKLGDSEETTGVLRRRRHDARLALRAEPPDHGRGVPQRHDLRAATRST